MSLLRQPVGKILLVFFLAHIDERQHGDRLRIDLIGRCRCRRCRQYRRRTVLRDPPALTAAMIATVVTAAPAITAPFKADRCRWASFRSRYVSESGRALTASPRR